VALPFKPAAKEEHFGMAMEEGGVRQLCVTIPDGVDFADLCLSRDVDDGQVRFRIAPIEAICEASDLNLDDILQGPQPLVVLIAAWYRVHIAQGGTPNPVQEDLLEETCLEEEHGGGFAYPPGHA
jgi:hypothetical protein